MCSYSLLLINSIFCCELGLFNFHVCQIDVVEVLIKHFCNYYHLRFLSPYEYQSEVNFGGQLQIQLWIHICVAPLKVPIHLWLQSHLCLTLDHGGDYFEYQQPYVIFKIEHFIPYFCLSQYYLLYVYISHISYFSSAILIALNDNLKLTLLCRLRYFFKD